MIVATVPVLFLGFWVERTAMEKELAAVEDIHLLLAQNITAALEGYVHDVRAAFDFFVDAANADGLNENVVSLAKELGFQVVGEPAEMETDRRAEGDCSGDRHP